jgi:hypothetical protein
MWTREQAVEIGRQNARAGGLARAARLSPERRAEIAFKAAALRWIREKSDLDRIDNRLAKLAMLEAWAAREGDFDRYLKAIQAQGPWERMRIMVRRFPAAEDSPGLTAEAESDMMRRLEKAKQMREASEAGEQRIPLISGTEFLALHAKSDKPEP